MIALFERARGKNCHEITKLIVPFECINVQLNKEQEKTARL